MCSCLSPTEEDPEASTASKSHDVDTAGSRAGLLSHTEKNPAHWDAAERLREQVLAIEDEV